MPFMQWTEMAAIDGDAVDEQHRGLFEAVNTFHEAVAGGHEQAAVARTLDLLLAYGERHFAEEERLLAASAYPRLDQHRRQHQQFLEQITAFQQQLTKSGSGIGHSMSPFLGSWLVNHIMVSDRAYAVFLRGGGCLGSCESSARLPLVSASATPLL